MNLFFAGSEWLREHGLPLFRAETTSGWHDAATATVSPDEAVRLEREGWKVPLERAVAEILEDPSL